MDPHIAKEVAALPRLSFAALRARYAQLFQEPTRVGNRLWLVRRIAWRLQALAEGDLSERARKRAAELANDADLRLLPPRAADIAQAGAGYDRTRSGPPAENGSAAYRNRAPSSPASTRARCSRSKSFPPASPMRAPSIPRLSAVAKAITGSHCNGFLFFNLHPGKEPAMSHRTTEQHRHAQARALCHLHAQIHRRRPGAGIQFAGRPARGGRGLHQEPGPRRLDLPARALRRRRLHRRQHGPACLAAPAGRHRRPARSTASSSTKSTG